MDRKGVGRVCLALNGVTLDHPWGGDHDAYKVGGKMFAMIGSMGGLSFKASDIAFEVLTESGKARPAPYLARAKRPCTVLAIKAEIGDPQSATFAFLAQGDVRRQAHCRG